MKEKLNPARLAECGEPGLDERAYVQAVDFECTVGEVLAGALAHWRGHA